VILLGRRSLLCALVILAASAATVPAFASTPTKGLELELTRLETQSALNPDGAQFEKFPQSALLIKSPEWDTIKASFEKDDRCEFYLHAIRSLENSAILASQFSYIQFRNGKLMGSFAKDPYESTFFNIRYWVSAYYLRKLTQVFANGMEGGGELDMAPKTCVAQNRDRILQLMLHRDEQLHQHLMAALPVELMNPALVDEHALGEIRHMIKRRDTFDKSLFHMGSAILGYGAFKGLSLFLKSRIASKVLRGLIVIAASGATVLPAALSDDEFEMDSLYLGEKDPQSMWDRLMSRIHLTSQPWKRGDVINAFLSLQKDRLRKIQPF